MLRYLKKTPAAETLPHTSDKEINSANKQVEIELDAQGLWKRKHSPTTHSYSDEIKTKIGRYAAENGNSYAITKFSNKLGWVVPESTVRNFKRAYLSELKACSDPELVHLREKVRGRPLLLGELDKKVQSYINP